MNFPSYFNEIGMRSTNTVENDFHHISKRKTLLVKILIILVFNMYHEQILAKRDISSCLRCHHNKDGGHGVNGTSWGGHAFSACFFATNRSGQHVQHDWQVCLSLKCHTQKPLEPLNGKLLPLSSLLSSTLVHQLLSKKNDSEKYLEHSIA